MLLFLTYLCACHFSPAQSASCKLLKLQKFQRFTSSNKYSCSPCVSQWKLGKKTLSKHGFLNLASWQFGTWSLELVAAKKITSDGQSMEGHQAQMFIGLPGSVCGCAQVTVAPELLQTVHDSSSRAALHIFRTGAAAQQMRLWTWRTENFQGTVC